MSLMSEAVQPTQQAKGLYPVLHSGLPAQKRKELFNEALRELSSSWNKFNTGWYKADINAPEQLKINDIFEDQGRRLFEMVQEMDNEFGALIVREGKEIQLAFFQVGKEHEISLAPTRPLKEDEFILGSIHGHPTRDYPSTTDIFTFLIGWEIVSVILGARGTIYLMLKTTDTKKPTESLEEFGRQYETGEKVRDIATDYNFILYLGKMNSQTLKLEVGDSQMKESSIDELLKEVKGLKTITKTIKKVRIDYDK